MTMNLKHSFIIVNTFKRRDGNIEKTVFSVYDYGNKKCFLEVSTWSSSALSSHIVLFGFTIGRVIYLCYVALTVDCTPCPRQILIWDRQFRQLDHVLIKTEKYENWINLSSPILFQEKQTLLTWKQTNYVCARSIFLQQQSKWSNVLGSDFTA